MIISYKSIISIQGGKVVVPKSSLFHYKWFKQAHSTGPWLGFYESCSRKNIYECSTHGSIAHNASIVNKIYTLSQANEIILLNFYRGIR